MSALWTMLGKFVENLEDHGMTVDGSGQPQPVDTDSRLLSELAYLRLKPFGTPKLAERIANTPGLCHLANVLYGTAASLAERDVHLRALLTSAAEQMDVSGGRAFLLLVGLTADTSGKRRDYRHEMAGAEMYPKPVSGATLARREYWKPFLESAVAAIQRTARAVPQRRDREKSELRNLALPIVERDLIDDLAYGLKDPFDPNTRACVLYGLPGTGRFTACDQALARVTSENRYVIRVGEPQAYHRDLLDLLLAYGVQAETWSLAACEREFKALVERSKGILGGVILQGASRVDDVAHLIPARRGAPILVTARHSARTPLRSVEELHVGSLEPERAKKLLGTGRPHAKDAQLGLLAELLYHHVGLLDAAARSRQTVATLIRRLRRARLDTIAHLASTRELAILDDARELSSKIAQAPDALLALDVALWAAEFDDWNLYHLVGLYLGLDASPDRLELAQRVLASFELHTVWKADLTLDLLRKERAHRMTPVLHQLAQLAIPERWQGAVSITPCGQDTSALTVGPHDRPVTLIEFLLGGSGYVALFCDRDGTPHAQLWRYADYGQDTFVLYEDGHCRGDHRLLDPRRDSLWPDLTFHMLDALSEESFPRLAKLGRHNVVYFFEGPIHQDPETFRDGFPESIDWDSPYNPLFGGYIQDPRDESIDEEAGEIFE